MLCELSWDVVMMCLMRGEDEREREVIVMKDDVDEMNNTCVVLGMRRKRNERNQESNTVLQISSNEGRECGSSTKQADAS